MTTSSDPRATPSRLKLLGGIAVATACGGLVALQSRVNGQLGSELSDGFAAAIISFGSGLLLLAIIVPLSRSGRVGLLRVGAAIRARSIPWWYLCSGFAGGLFVLAQGLTAAILGVALFTVAAVAGQTLSSLVLDARGLGTVAPVAVTPQRVAGATLSLVAVAVAVSTRLIGDVPVWMLVMPFLVGLALAWQQAVNGQVKAVANSALTATVLNFLGGTVLLAIGAAVHTVVVGWPRYFPQQPWLYVGGVIAVVFIAGLAAVVRTIGVLLLSLAAVAGQLLMSLALDLIAPTDATRLAWTTVVGTALTLVAVVIATIPRRRTEENR